VGKLFKMTRDRPNIERDIQGGLTRIAREEGVQILYACESGSRAWGFASADSDYDVRFIYVRRPSWYLSIELELRPSTIERPITGLLDFSGWDLRKALQLLRKSNPPLLEWLRSPTVYVANPVFLRDLRRLAARAYSPVRTFHHYRKMAEGNYRDYLRGSRVRTKKYFYVLRPLLAWQWVLIRKSPPPMEFEALLAVSRMPSKVRREVHKLLVDKRLGREMDEGPRIDALNRFIENAIERPVPKLLAPHLPLAVFDRFFQRWQQ
jgi:predicted nucleotidyltransferase